MTLTYRTTRATSTHDFHSVFFPSLRSTFICSLYSLKPGVYFHTSVSTCGSLPLSPPVSFFCNFLKPNFASSFAKAAFLAGFHCINPRCFLLSVLLFALLWSRSSESSALLPDVQLVQLVLRVRVVSMLGFPVS